MILEKLQRTVVFEQNPGIREGQIASFDDLEAGMELIKVSPGIRYSEYNTETERWDLMGEPEVAPDLYREPVTLEAVRMRLSGGHSLGVMAMLPKYASLTPDDNFIVLRGRGEQIDSGIDATNTWSVLTFSKADLGLEPYMRGSEVRGWGVSYLRHRLPTEKIQRGVSRMTPNEIMAKIPGVRYL